MKTAAAGRRATMTVAALVITATMVALGLTASASGNTARPAHTKVVLHFVAKVNKIKILRQGAIGGGGIARYRLTDAGTGEPVGTVYQEGTNVWDEQGLGTWGIVFNDSESSQITSVGLFSAYDDVHVVPVTGGSGTYQGVTGEASWQFFGKDNNKAHLTITVEGVTS
jgi:hypothetical protein